MIAFRQAKPEDTAGIVNVKNTVWPAETTDAVHISKIITDPDHVTLVAVAEDSVIGFVDGFVTCSHDGVSRWEVDLLAVHPAYQGQSIAKQLIRGSTDVARHRGASVVRALIHTKNEVSKRAFSGCGYTPEENLCGLYISFVPAAPTHSNGGLNHLTQQAPFIPVKTLNYEGMWLEGELTSADFEKATMLQRQYHLGVCGAVIPMTSQEIIAFAEQSQYQFIGYYQYWTKRL